MNDQYLNTLLFSLIGDVTLVKQWWNGPNLGFDGRCPKDVPYEQVKNYLEEYCFGQ